MYISEFFRAEQDLLRFFSCYPSGLADADAGLCIITEVDAPLAFKVSRSFADHSSEFAALARCDPYAVSRLVEPV